eukprot:GHVP01060349.1.p1 GENE.GHVP01060349.1~~GHVP01060349.1.p1  ORF type:complete len:105 (-),score=21.89 GHVP01060349.1:835-1149(-)
MWIEDTEIEEILPEAQKNNSATRKSLWPSSVFDVRPDPPKINAIFDGQGKVTTHEDREANKQRGGANIRKRKKEIWLADQRNKMLKAQESKQRKKMFHFKKPTT